MTSKCWVGRNFTIQYRNITESALTFQCLRPCVSPRVRMLFTIRLSSPHFFRLVPSSPPPLDVSLSLSSASISFSSAWLASRDTGGGPIISAGRLADDRFAPVIPGSESLTGTRAAFVTIRRIGNNVDAADAHVGGVRGRAPIDRGLLRSS